VVIDYWLPVAAQGEITLDIIDASGARVQRLTSEAIPRPDAEAYFNAAWLRPPSPLDRSAGLHRTVWNLRWTRPAGLAFDYSISTAAGTDTPINPQGPLALPGQYQLVLSVDGAAVRAPLSLVQDPRVPGGEAGMAESLALSKSIGEDLALARRGYGEIAAARAGVIATAARLRTTKTGAGLAARLEAFAKLSDPVLPSPGFLRVSKTLAALESDLEASDLAPTVPQNATRSASRAQIDRLWSAWSTLRDRDLPVLNRAIRRAGLPAVTIPTPDRLTIELPEGGQDLP
jgi:hypothetical protein